MSVIVKGDSPFDAFIVSGIKDCQKEHIKFYNISFNCKTIEDADGRTFTRSEERKKGKWNFIGDQMFECSECGTYYTQSQFHQMRVRISDTEFPKFCPNCGADMKGDSDG